LPFIFKASKHPLSKVRKMFMAKEERNGLQLTLNLTCGILDWSRRFKFRNKDIKAIYV
jgi:hypothetical protein